MEMSCKEAAEILRNPVAGLRVITLDGKPEVGLTSDYCRAIEVALEALEGVEVQGQVIVNLNRDIRAMRKAMNGQSEYAYLGGDLISREALTERVEMINWYSVNNRGVLHSGAADNESAYVRYVDVCQVIKDTLGVEAEPVVHAHWEKTPHQYGFVRCSVCRDCNVWDEWTDGKKWNYCPHCGARMDEEVTNA